MALPLMPKATAVWLVDNTTLTFEQIAEFCGLHDLEVQAIADGEVAEGIVGLDPIGNGQLTREEIAHCEGDPAARLKLAESDLPRPEARPKGARYTPVSRRQDRPDAIAWLVKYHPELTDAQIARLIGTTKPTITAVRERTHWNTPNIRPRDPVTLGLCTQTDLNAAAERALKRQAKEREKAGLPAEAETDAAETPTRPTGTFAEPPPPAAAVPADVPPADENADRDDAPREPEGP